MKVREAWAVASRWVAAHAGAIPGFAGAFLSGSAIWLPAEEELPATSDVDLLVYPALLGQLGCADLTRAQAERHLEAMTAVFDATAAVARTPFPFAADITAAARPVAVDGSRELVARGDHREAVFWIVATYARCLKLLHADAPALVPTFEPGFHALLADLGIATLSDLPQRARQLRAFLPEVTRVSEAILAANPAIRR